MATVTVNGLECGVTYNITAGGTLNGELVGPRSSHGSITAGPCPPMMTTTIIPTTSMTSKKRDNYSKFKAFSIHHECSRSMVHWAMYYN